MRASVRSSISVVATIVVVGATALAATPLSNGSPPAQGAGRAPGAPGENEFFEIAERISAYENASIAGTVGRIAPVRRAPSPGWAGARILHPRANDWEPAIAADPSSPWVYIMVTRFGKPVCGRCPGSAMMIERSRDGGRTWTKARPVCRCRGTSWQADPIIEVVPDTGAVYAIWLNGWNTVFSRSDDHGRTWTPPVSTKARVAWNDKPAMAVSDDGQDVWVTWNGPNGGDPYVSRSRDGGVTWRPRRVVRSERYYFAYNGAVTSDGVVALAQSSISYTGPGGAPAGAVKHHALISDDDGGSWRNVIVASVRVGAPCTSAGCSPDYYTGHSAIAADEDGGLYFVFDGALRNGARQRTFVSTSADGGDTWSEPIALSEPHEQSGFPMVVATGSGDVRMWYMQTRDGDANAWNVWYRESANGGTTWSEPARLSDVTSGYVYVSHRGFREPYGDYGEIAITSIGKTIATWGQGMSYSGPGGVWFNRQR